jgi:hypothetical protein
VNIRDLYQTATPDFNWGCFHMFFVTIH